jgi:uncharacterized protein YukE
MAFVGMEVEAVRTLARELSQKANEIEQIAGQLTSQLSGTNWVGSDATQFRNEWDSQHVRALKTVATALQTASTAATKNANDQEAASQ